MRHRVKGRTLGRSHSHRAAMLRNIIISLVEHELITTTVERAKETRPLAEKIISLGKKGDLHARRQAIALLQNKAAVKKIFDDIALRNANRPGGYTRILRLNKNRLGDNASQAIFELVERTPAEAPVTENA